MRSMAPHLIFFTFGLAFLSGVAFAGLGLSAGAVFIPAAILFAALYLLRADGRVAALVAAIMICGAGYYAIADAGYQARVAAFPHTGTITGMISTDPSRMLDAQSFYLRTAAGTVAVTAGAYPPFRYGDLISVEGSVKRPPESSYGDYLAKEGVVATVQAERIALTAPNAGNPALRFVFAVKDRIHAAYVSLLAPEQAALLSGVTLGMNNDLSPAFLQDLSVSGTRHVTAVSGLHMAILFFVVFSLGAYFFSRTFAAISGLLIVGAFVALTGFSVSAIRAAFLVGVASLAMIVQRKYEPRNALVLAALILTFANPKVLVFDTGFQLSFLAVLAIIYLKPILMRAAGGEDRNGLFGLRDALAVTIAAQIATAPILIVQFQNFSLTAFAANMLVVPAVPYVMVSGLVMAAVAAVAMPAAHLLSFIVAPLAGYVIAAVTITARIAVLFDPDLGTLGMIGYYAVLFGLIYWFSEPQPVTAPEMIKPYVR
ncbi:ComEC/Rec2 family competence protein [Patescibacteria group bacterium]|nr:ComEC/Rec2 family competence protein [Patescibacteria group bacterium]